MEAIKNWHQIGGLCSPSTKISKISNHIPLNCIIGAKRIMFKVMYWHYKHCLNLDPFQVIPTTFNFQKNTSSELLKSFISQFGHIDNIWIMKPGQNTNRGKGIRVVNTKNMISILKKEKDKHLIVQSYLKPFLYNGRKFDIRHYFLITSMNGWVRAYWFDQGYIRTSSQKYTLDDLDNDFIHLTNDAIQKHGPKYGKYEQANKVSYAQFQRYLDTVYPQKHYDFQTQIAQKMKEMTKELVKASFQFLDPTRKGHNFELFGLDFIINSKFKPYLLECNANPCLQINCPLLQKIIPAAVQHAFRLAVDPLYPPPEHYPIGQRYYLPDKILEKLKYTLIFDERIEGEALRQSSRDVISLIKLEAGMLAPEQDMYQNDGIQIEANQFD